VCKSLNHLFFTLIIKIVFTSSSVLFKITGTLLDRVNCYIPILSYVNKYYELRCSKYIVFAGKDRQNDNNFRINLFMVKYVLHICTFI